MKLADAKSLALLPPVVFTQAHDLHLAERIDEVGRIERAASRLALRVRALHVALAHEELDALFVTHPFGVHLDADEIATQSRERGLKLRQSQLRIVSAEALVEHHLLAVVRPTLDERVCAERRAQTRVRARERELLVVVARIDLRAR